MAGERILVTDDEELLLGLCRRILIKQGYTVETASSGNGALEICGRSPFDILLTDIKMPGMDGLHLIEQVRKVQPEITAMVITGHGTIDTAVESLKLGVMGFIVKPFTPDALLTSIQDVLKKKQMAQENARLKHLMSLFEITKEVPLDRVFHQILEVCVKETRSEVASLMFLDHERQELVSKASIGFPPGAAMSSEKRVGEGIASWVAKTAQPLLLQGGSEEDPEEDPWYDLLLKNSTIASALSVPLAKQGKIIGVLNLAKRTKKSSYTKSDLELVTTLCGQAAIAIENAKLFEEVAKKTQDLKNAHFDAIKALAEALETKDLYTRGHSDRTTRYAVAVAEGLGLSPAEQDHIRYAAILHDIGKIGIPEEVLNKGEKLSPQEYEVMKRHPQIGAQIIGQVKSLAPVVPIVLHDHEHYDGSGYPEGLAGEAIPLGSRIIAVVDAYDAITTDRSYRKAPGRDFAFQELRRCSGTQFDPAVVEAFFQLLKQKPDL